MNGFTYQKGQGRHYGIPSRDLTQAEFEALTPNLQRIVRESPAYRAKGGTPPKAETKPITKAADTGKEAKD